MIYRRTLEPGGVLLIPHIGFLTKNQSPNFSPPDIFVPSLTCFSSIKEDKLWCPVRILKFYIDRTKGLRGDTTQLFITTVRPYHAASTICISRWIIEAISLTTTPGPAATQPPGSMPGPPSRAYGDQPASALTGEPFIIGRHRCNMHLLWPYPFYRLWKNR